MLIRWATPGDKPAWLALSKEYDGSYVKEYSNSEPCYNDTEWCKGFDGYMDRKICRNNAVVAEDRMTGCCSGIIAFSKKHNEITFFAVDKKADFDKTAEKLLLVALRQLDTNKEITAWLRLYFNNLTKTTALFGKYNFTAAGSDNVKGLKLHRFIRKATDEKRGGSFHYNYDNWAKQAQKEFCPCCNNLPAPDDLLDIAELESSFATAERAAQGRLFGKCHVLAKKHIVHFEDMPEEDMAAFMADVQRTARALRRVTGAIKINYEIHANSGPHLHCHLFPRYLDDDFPSAPIDYRITEPSPYESEEEFLWFVERMRKELINELN
jgi:diadenosine tetraphosphate (Ap4A) HIT family hydrolase